MTQSIGIIGGGITGLAAAWELRADAEVTLLEVSPRVGGKISMGPVGGLTVDAGADAFLARVPWATTLCEELDLGSELVSPATRNAFIYAGGTLHPIPAAQVLGVPLDPEALPASGLVGEAGAAVAARDLDAPDALLEGDESIGALIRRRLGDDVLEALVDPLLSGVNAGDVDHLSVRACAPQLAEAAERSGSLIKGLQELMAERTGDANAPVFHSLTPGAARLVDELAERLGSSIHTDHAVRALTRLDDGRWSVDVDTGSVPTEFVFDGVVLCLPGSIAASLIPDADEFLSEIEYSDVALITLVFDREGVDHPMDGSGFLVQRGEGMLLTAASWSSTKWDHVGGADSVVIRASVGRDGDERHLALDDAALVDAVLADLETVMGGSLSPRDVRVTHYRNSLAQYRPGHLDRMTQVRAHLPPGLALAGAGYDGIGIPACIHSGRTNARSLVT